MAVDDEMSRRFLPWGLPLRSGAGYRVTPRPDEPVYVTGAYLLDSESDVGQGAVDACVHIDTRNLLSALLSPENPRVELQTPVRLEMGKECCFHAVPHGGDSDVEAGTEADADTGANVDADADEDGDADDDADVVIVMFEGFLVTPRPLDTEEEEDDDEAELLDTVTRPPVPGRSAATVASGACGCLWRRKFNSTSPRAAGLPKFLLPAPSRSSCRPPP